MSALKGEPLRRPPVWVMRQAGRYLPEYRRLKEIHGFLKMVKTPHLAMEVTLQPLRRFPLDAAILFSDILVIPEAMGQPYAFREEGGIAMDFAINSPQDLARLSEHAIPEKLSYMADALRLLKEELKEQKALLGFGGSPWTLATYMVEGGSSSSFSKIKTLYFEDPVFFHRLLEKITRAVVSLFEMQIEAGADAIQIFDSWGSACPGNHYHEMSLRWIREVISQLPKDFPIILFSKGMSHHLTGLIETGADALSFDQSVHLPSVRRLIPPQIAVQGNFDPTLMELSPSIVERETLKFLNSMRHFRGFIANLGHGITPQGRIESMEAFTQTIANYR